MKLLILNTFAAKVYKDNGYKNLSIFLHTNFIIRLRNFKIQAKGLRFIPLMKC
jgi:hypothetical protein